MSRKGAAARYDYDGYDDAYDDYDEGGYDAESRLEPEPEPESPYEPPEGYGEVGPGSAVRPSPSWQQGRTLTRGVCEFAMRAGHGAPHRGGRS